MSIFNSLKNIFGGDETSPRNRARRFRLFHQLKLPDMLQLHGLSFSADGQTLATGCGKTLLLWNVQSGSLLWQKSSDESFASRVAFSPDGNTLAASGTKTVRQFHVADGQLVQTFEGHKSAISRVVFSPDGHTLARADQSVWLWRVADGKSLGTLHGHEGSIGGLSFSPDGQILATGSSDGKIKLWCRSDKHLICTLEGHTHVYDVAFSSDGRMLASAGYSSPVIVWSVPDGKRVCSINTYGKEETYSPSPGVIEPRYETVYAIACSPDGQMLLTGGDNKKIRLWHVADGQLLRQSLLKPGSITSVAFSPDGRMLALTHENLKNWSVQLWGIE